MNALVNYWIITLLVTLFLFLLIGVLIKGNIFGVLIDSRGKMSLSRFQLSVWSWLIISTFFAVGRAFRTMNI